MHSNFHWTQHFCGSRSLEELSQLDAGSVNVWSCPALGKRMRWGSAFARPVQLLDWCSALVCSMCPLVTTELLKTILNLPLHTLPLFCLPWFLQSGILTFVFPAVNCGGPAVCRLPTSSFFPGCRNEDQALKRNLRILSEYFLWDSWEGP